MASAMLLDEIPDSAVQKKMKIMDNFRRSIHNQIDKCRRNINKKVQSFRDLMAEIRAEIQAEIEEEQRRKYACNINVAFAVTVTCCQHQVDLNKIQELISSLTTVKFEQSASKTNEMCAYIKMDDPADDLKVTVPRTKQIIDLNVNVKKRSYKIKLCSDVAISNVVITVR